MLLYNWKKIYSVSNGNVGEIYKIFEMLVKKSIPTHRGDDSYKYSKMNFRGLSFLAHADVLLYNAYKYSQKELAAYIATASYRSISEYAATQTITLELLHVPFADFLVNNINNNRLLHIDDDKILILAITAYIIIE